MWEIPTVGNTGGVLRTNHMHDTSLLVWGTAVIICTVMICGIVYYCMTRTMCNMNMHDVERFAKRIYKCKCCKKYIPII